MLTHCRRPYLKAAFVLFAFKKQITIETLDRPIFSFHFQRLHLGFDLWLGPLRLHVEHPTETANVPSPNLYALLGLDANGNGPGHPDYLPASQQRDDEGHAGCEHGAGANVPGYRQIA